MDIRRRLILSKKSSGGDIDTTYSIMYTSSDGNVVTPYNKTDVFDANITSNTYVNGQGIIAFDGPVTSIGSHAFYSTSLTSITIPDSVTKIGDDAFRSCTSLTSVTIGNSVTEITDLAFQNCRSLKSITIPNSVTKIGSSVFHYCTSMTSVTIGNSVTSIGSYAFQRCTSLTSITIPDSVTEIRNEVFYECTSLRQVYCKATTPSSLGYGVFDNNASDRKIYVPTASVDAYKSAQYWSNYADYIVGYDFEDDGESGGDVDIDTTYSIMYTSSDGNVVTPYSTTVFGANITSNTYINGQGIIIFDGPVTSIGKNAFRNCTSLTSITIPASVTSIENMVFFGCRGLTSVTIPNSVTTIGYHAFRSCESLTSIIIPDSVTSIGYNAFEGCTSLTSVTIPDIVTSIENYVFYRCSSLTSVIIPNSVTSIGESAFSGCASLTSVTIPNRVTSIGDDAFYGCNVLTSVYCKATTPPTLGGSDVFIGNASSRKIYVPTASVSAYKAASRWSKYAAYIEGYDF